MTFHFLSPYQDLVYSGTLGTVVRSDLIHKMSLELGAVALVLDDGAGLIPVHLKAAPEAPHRVLEEG